MLSVCTASWTQRPELVVQVGHSQLVCSVAFSADSRTLASGSWDNTIKLWDVGTGRLMRTLIGHSSDVSSVAFSPDGKTLASGSDDLTIKLWDVASGRELRTLTGHSHLVTSIAFSVDGKKLVSGSWDFTIKVWQVATGRELRTITGHGDQVTSVAFSGDNKTIASASWDQTAALWDASTGRELHTLNGHSGVVSSVAFGLNGKILASGGWDQTIKLWDVATGRELRTLTGHEMRVTSVAFSADGKTVASGSEDRTIKLWDVATGRELRALTLSDSGYVGSVAFSRDGKTLANGNYDHTIKLWDVATGRDLRTLTGPSDISSVVFSLDGQTLASGTGAGTIELWEMSTGRELHTLTGHSNNVTSVTFNPDGKTLASSSEDKTIKLWDVSTGHELRTLTGQPPRRIFTVAFSIDGKTLASDGYNGAIKVWDVATGRELRTLTGHGSEVTSVAFCADGKTLASDDGDEVKLWDVATGQELRTITRVSGYDRSVAFSVDCKTLAGSGKETIKLWEVATGRELRTLTGHSEVVRSIALNRDGKTLASGSEDNTIKLWEMTTGRELRTLAGHSDKVTAVAFSVDGMFLVSGGEDATIKVWRVDTGELLASLISFDKSGWVVVTPEGRFDTTSLEEIPSLRWVFPDDPFKSLPPEIFMRQYYEPRLLPRLLQNRNFAPVPALASLNRVQPEVKIRSVVPATNSKGYVQLTVDVGNATGEQMRDGKRVTLNSEVYDLRLFRDGQLVGYVPGKLPLDSTGKATINRAVKLPQRGELNDIEFTAYAFNSDQVKSATSNFTYKPAQALPPVKGRAYVISVGVNAYEDPAWNLSFAARDAQVSDEMLTRKLAAMGEYEVVPIKLTSDYQKSSGASVLTERLATKQNFHAVLDVLGEGAEKVDANVLKLIPGADRLRRAEPEDLVLISFSSHGYTDKQGKFYLVPYDTGRNIEFSADGQAIAAESLAHFISSDELSEWVRDIDAAELVMIVDTCHSASAVDEPGFKPGPMGSRGMGQLAYDKGMRILAASQADDVALELDRLQHGLLTYALIEEGLNQRKADNNGDGRITLDEWLAYGAERVPTLYNDVKDGRVEALKSRDVHITSLISGRSVEKNAFQQPQLFDFKRKEREVVIAGAR
jgi:WD40 repeat protein/uncharacterized caspase-like protein